MFDKSKLYIGSVIVAGALVLASSLWNWSGVDPGSFLIFLSLALFASMLKVKLPGITGAYSLVFFFILVGILHFSLSETLVVGCAGALMQSLWRAKRRPTLVQVLFNLGNFSLSIGLCYWLARVLLAGSSGAAGAGGLAVVICLFFVVNTGLVSGVLSLLQKQPLQEVARHWYLWSFPYYLVGAVLVSLLPLSGQALRADAWLLLVPPLCLIHFYYSLTRQGQVGPQAPADDALSVRAKLYLSAVITAGITLSVWGLLHWESEQGIRLLGYLSVVILASTLKVRLPGMTGTISVNFVVLLAAIVELSLSEVMVLAATAALAQALWQPARRPQAIRVVFSAATLVLSTGAGFVVCRLWLADAVAESLPSVMVATCAALYLCNTLLVSLAWCLAEGRPLRDIWPQCCFWSFPYYLVGAAVAAVMVLTSQAIGWGQSFLALPLMLLIYVSYRMHVNRAARAMTTA